MAFCFKHRVKFEDGKRCPKCAADEGAERVYTIYCHRHDWYYKFGSRCPKCAADEVKAKPYAISRILDYRWRTLCSNPDRLNQDKFGICGMTSAVYLLLKHNKTRAQELYQATFADLIPSHHGCTFQVALGHTPIAIVFSNLARRYQLGLERSIRQAPAEMKKAGWDNEAIGKEPQKYQKLIQEKQVNTACFVDFCVARGLGYVFKDVAKSRYNGEKTEFNLEFSDPHGVGDNSAYTRHGGFALRTNNLAFILSNILGAHDVRIASKYGGPPAAVPLAPLVEGVGLSTFRDVNELEKEFDNHFGSGDTGKFAVVSVFGDLCQPDVEHVSKASPAGAKQGTKQRNQLTYNHWVVFNSFTNVGTTATCKKNHIRLEIWTWGADRNISVCEEYLLSYIQDVIFGRF